MLFKLVEEEWAPTEYLRSGVDEGYAQFKIGATLRKVREAAGLSREELANRLSGRGEQPQLYFWRTSAGVEVDLVVETAGRLIPIEVKSSATPFRSKARNIESFRKDLGGIAEKGYVVHPGVLYFVCGYLLASLVRMTSAKDLRFPASGLVILAFGRGGG